MTRPLIGLTGRRIPGTTVMPEGTPLAASGIDMYWANYAESVMAAGGIPLHLPVDLDPSDVIDRLDGLLLPGGADIDPAHYGAEVDGSRGIDAERDRYELALLDQATQAEVPILGICRGAQIVNVHAGGTLAQHVDGHADRAKPGSERVHQVEFSADTRLAEMYGSKIEVNSLHHQTVDRVGEGFRVTGRAPDGGVEAIESIDGSVIGVQWHPELHDERASDPLFGWLVAAAARR